MTIEKKLLKAAKDIDKGKTSGCCEILSGDARKYFINYFFPFISEKKFETDVDFWRGRRGYWMAQVGEDQTEKKVLNRRIFALLLAREIYLSEKK